MKYRVATIYYNDSTDETTIKFADDYYAWDALLRADIIGDANGIIDGFYTEAVNILHKEGIENRKAALKRKKEENNDKA